MSVNAAICELAGVPGYVPYARGFTQGDASPIPSEFEDAPSVASGGARWGVDARLLLLLVETEAHANPERLGSA
jgi:hypothetical protein